MLTARQQEIWQFLVEYTDGHGYPPTVREIGEAVGLASPSTVHAHLANLERAGLLKRDPSKPRALDLIGHRAAVAASTPAPVEEIPRLPLLGQIAAGAPLLAEENVEDRIAVPACRSSPSPCRTASATQAPPLRCSSARCSSRRRTR